MVAVVTEVLLRLANASRPYTVTLTSALVAMVTSIPQTMSCSMANSYTFLYFIKCPIFHKVSWSWSKK